MTEIKTIHEVIQEISPHYNKKGEPEAFHTLGYESYAEALEPIYFFILDLMNDFRLAPEKLVDNFISTPGSGHFSELMGKATQMQQQGASAMQTINVLVRSILNLVHDLRDFKIRLQVYDDLKSKEKEKNGSAKLSLKQIWLDKVDILKGNSSIKGMALGQAGFQTLLDAFLLAKDEKEADKLDLNDRVKRIIKARIHEFNIWLEQSEKELRKRYEIQRDYLKSQVNSLKLYSRWVRPYLKAAQQLEMKSAGIEREPALVKAFNTIMFELTLLGKSKIDVDDSAFAGELPKDFRKMKLKRDYYSCILIDFKFRGVPHRIKEDGHYSFGGKSEVNFRAYALNDDEFKKLNQELEQSDLEGVLGFIEGATSESLGQLQEEINFFLEEKDEVQTEKEKSRWDNPFSALIGKYEKSEKSKESGAKEKKIDSVKPDDWIEKNHLRKLAAEKAADTAYKLFDIYKKAHGMVSFT